jgi:hypothetical protein
MINKKLGLMALLASCAIGKIMAGNLTNYTSGDVLISFRTDPHGTYNMVVDAGPLSTLTNGVTPNQRISIAQYTSSQLTAAFGSVDGLDWSAYTWASDNTLFLTKARPSLNSKSGSWSSLSSSLQSLVAKQMALVPGGASYIYRNGSGFPESSSTTTCVIEPEAANGYDITGTSYDQALYDNGANPNFGNLANSPEITTPSGFDSAGTVVRSDFYQVPPGSGTHNVTYLGYFEFASNGSMTYVAYPSTIPVIQSISRSGNVSTINYTAGLYGTYRLRGTNTLTSGTSPTNWPAISTLTSGDTSVHTYLDTDSSPNKFYIITAQ